MTIMEERVAVIAAHATKTFGGDASFAVRWMQTPEEALDGKSPASLLWTDYGYSMVLSCLADLTQVGRLAA